MALWFLIVVAVVGIGLKPLKNHVPLAVNCSAAISAACHPPADDTNAALQPIMWGEIPMEAEVGDTGSNTDRLLPGSRRASGEVLLTGVGPETTEDEVQAVDGQVKTPGSGLSTLDSGTFGYAHCSFTSHEVVTPSKVRLYV